MQQPGEVTAAYEQLGVSPSFWSLTDLSLGSVD